MAALVGIDARVDMSTNWDPVLETGDWAELPERNEFSISIRVDVAEHKPFVASLADAWVGKARTWMNWNGSLRGYYDDASDTIFDTMVDGEAVYMRFYDTRANEDLYWEGQVLLTSVEHSTGSEDFSTLSVDFEGLGALARVVVP
jgi:hypothetical protein